MRLRFNHTAAALACLLVSSTGAYPQEGTWTITGGGGYAHIDLSAVKDDMKRDVQGYNNAGYEIPPFASPSSALALYAKSTYRFDRDYSVAFSIHHDGRTVKTSWSDPERALTLERSMRALVVSAGLVYHAPMGWEGDVFGEVQIGMLFARATSNAYRTRTFKLTDSSLTTTTEVLDDTRGEFTKTKLTVAASVGGTVRLAGPLIFRGELLYRLGQIGTIDGEVTTFGQTRTQTTSIEFNFSGIMILASVGIEFY